MTIRDGKPETVTNGKTVVEIQYKQLDAETREKHIRALVRAMARRAAWEDHVRAIKSREEGNP